MKKIVLTAALAAFAIGANAQNANDQANVNINVTLVEVIEISPSNQNAVAFGTFNTIAEYENGKDLLEFPEVLPVGPGTFEFVIAASCAYDVNVLAPAFFTGGAGDMPISDLKLRTVSLPSGSTGGYPAFTSVTPGMDLFEHPTGHFYSGFGMDLRLEPGYGHQGGDYSATITLDATTL